MGPAKSTAPTSSTAGSNSPSPRPTTATTSSPPSGSVGENHPCTPKEDTIPKPLTPQDLEPFDTYIVNVSGGKDSTATLLWALDHLPHDRLRVIYCETGAEWPETYAYLDYLADHIAQHTNPTLQLERIQAGDRPIPPQKDGTPRPHPLNHVNGTLEDLIRCRGMWPAFYVRWCNTFLKRWPGRLYAAEHPNPVHLLGLRAGESKPRSKLPNIATMRTRQTASVFLPKAPPHAYPVLTWSANQVFTYITDHGLAINPAYNYTNRCSCWCCPLTSIRSVRNFCRVHPDIAQHWVDLEREIEHDWRSDYSLAGLFAQAKEQPTLFQWSDK